jgi:hypothetical protein
VNAVLRELIDNGTLEKLAKGYPGDYLFVREGYNGVN